VLPVLRYSDLDEVVARVNDTEFGLGGSVWSSDVERGVRAWAARDRFRHRLGSTSILMSGWTSRSACAKQSGLGRRVGPRKGSRHSPRR